MSTIDIATRRLGLALASMTAVLTTAAAAQDADQIVVTASATPLEARKVGSAVSVVTAEDIEAQGIRYVADALRHVPGVAVSRTGVFGGTTQLRLRGAEGNHVLVLVDGVEAAQGGGNELDLASLLASGIERIEVLRGPQSGLYGSNALAGVVNIITRRGGDGFAADMSAEAGSYDTRHLALAVSGGAAERHGALDLAYREAFLDASPTGSEKDGDENLSLSGRGRLVVSDRLTLDGGFRVVDRRVASDEQDFLTGAVVDAPDVADYDDAQLSARATWTGGRWNTVVSGSRYEGEAAARDSFGLASAKTRRDQLSFSSTVDLATEAAVHALTGFVQHKEESFRDFSSASAQKLERSVLGVGVEYRGEFGERVFFSGTVRDDANDGFDDTTTYRATVAFLLDERTRLHSSYGIGVTNPTFIEQFGFGSAWVGNPDLEPEKAEGWDVGVERRFAGGRLTFDATYFDADLENEIEFAPPFFDRSRNREGVSRRRGVELTLAGRLTERLGVNAAFTYTDAEDPPPEDPAEEVRRPPRMASVDFTYALDGGRARFHAGAVYNGRMLDVDPALGFLKGPVSAFTLVNAGASFALGERLEVFGRIENLLDERYEEVIGFAAPGRGVLAGLRFRFAETR